MILYHFTASPPPVRDSNTFFKLPHDPSYIATLKFQISELRLQLHGKEANILALREENKDLLKDLIKERRKNSLESKKEKKETYSQTETVARLVVYEASEDSASSTDSGKEFQNLMDQIPTDLEDSVETNDCTNETFVDRLMDDKSTKSSEEPDLINQAMNLAECSTSVMKEASKTPDEDIDRLNQHLLKQGEEEEDQHTNKEVTLVESASSQNPSPFWSAPPTKSLFLFNNSESSP